MNHESPRPSPEAQVILESLRTAVANALDKKKKLGHYAVVWQDGRPVQYGADAPLSESQTR